MLSGQLSNSETGHINSVFERKEIKYKISKEQHDGLLCELEGHMAPDMYGLTTICNIYFDTPEFRLIRESIEKPLYKEKLRLRTYGVPNGSSNAFIELKKKFSGIVYKRRIVLPYDEAIGFIVDRVLPADNDQIVREIDWVLDRYAPLVPAMALFYDRIAYVDRDDAELRLTLDKDIRFRVEDVDLKHGADGEPLLESDQYIMEIKISNAMPLWLVRALDKYKIYPCSFSKCGSAYTKQLNNGGIL